MLAKLVYNCNNYIVYGRCNILDRLLLVVVDLVVTYPSWFITPITICNYLWFMVDVTTDNYSIHRGLYTNKHHCGAPHCRG